jgi:hypothetical protein
VRVERVEPEPVADACVEVVRDGCEPRFARRLGLDVRDLLALEQVRPARRPDRHAYIVPVDSNDRGAALARLRSHPKNLIRVMPAKGDWWFHVA